MLLLRLLIIFHPLSFIGERNEGSPSSLNWIYLFPSFLWVCLALNRMVGLLPPLSHFRFLQPFRIGFEGCWFQTYIFWLRK